VRAFAAETAPLEITFDRAGSFTGGVVYLAPAPSAGLRRLHAAFHARCEDLSRSVWHHYQPDFWMPHLTLAMDLEPSQVAPALAIAETIRLPLPARLVEVGIVEFRPVRELAGYPLAGR
jgi:2'-5' RNA ligase